MTKLENFIEKAKIVHKGENLDYSKVVYKNNRTPVLIIDHDLDEDGNEYGEFWQSPWNHLKGQCHPKKRGKRISASKSSKQEDVIERFKKVHAGENLDYSQVKYVNMHTKVKIISHDLRPDGTEYGEFWQEPVVHLKGCSHPDIAADNGTYKKRYGKQSFVNSASKKHNDIEKYDFSETEYDGSKKKVKIFCNAVGKNGKPHGYFWIEAESFVQGRGCPICANSTSHKENDLYDYICSIVGKENVERKNKKILNGKEIDIFIPKLKVGFEYDGVRWHSEEFGKGHGYHLKKTEEAKKRGVTLFHIFEDEYRDKKEIVENKVSHILGGNAVLKKIGARKCKIVEVSAQTAAVFLEKFHIQGFVPSTLYLGLEFNDEIVSVMSFLNDSDGKWNLTRYATNFNYVCQGGASKLLKYFIEKWNPLEIKSFLDRRWCRNEHDNLYTKIGFKFDGYLKPDYRYFTGDGQRHHKFGFRKQILHKKYGFPLSMTEKEMTEKLGYKRIWDCGLIRYVWKIDQ